MTVLVSYWFVSVISATQQLSDRVSKETSTPTIDADEIYKI